MTDDDDLAPGSPLPRNAAEMDRLLRRVPEVALLPELASLRFDPKSLGGSAGQGDAHRIARLADETYIERLGRALADLVAAAKRENNGGLHFVAASLLHFVRTVPPERHPLIVALYFLSLSGSEPMPPEDLAHRMDEYDEVS